jgi:hypothetical protein
MKQDEDKSEVGSSYSKAETKSEYTALHLIQSNWKTCCIKDDDPEISKTEIEMLQRLDSPLIMDSKRIT